MQPKSPRDSDEIHYHIGKVIDLVSENHKMSVFSRWMGKLLVFVFVFFAALWALFFFIFAERYQGKNEISLRFPVAVIDQGVPTLIQWKQYVTDPDSYKSRLIANASSGVFTTADGQQFSLTPLGAGKVQLTVSQSWKRQSAEYAIEAEMVKPLVFKQLDIFLLWVALSLALIATAIFYLLERQWKRASSR